MQSIATITDDVEDREISAAEIHGVHPHWAHGGGARPGTEGAFRLRLPKHHSGFARPEAGGPRRSQVSKGLRGGGHEAGELSGIRPRVDGQRKGLRERRRGTAWEFIVTVQAQCPARLQVVSNVDTEFDRRGPVMSATTTLIEGKPTVWSDVLGERAQELDCVVSRYLPMFYKRALRFLGNAPDAEDAVQDALLSAYRHLGQFRGQAQLSSWLMTIVTNAALMKLRRRHSGYFSLDEEQGEEGLKFSERLADSKPSPEEVCFTVEARNRLVEGVQRLSPKLRRTFQLRDIDGLTTKEAAHVLGIPQGTVKAQLARARAKLAGIMRGKPVRQRVPNGFS